VGRSSDGQLNVTGWTGIQQVAAGASHTVGLKADGTVVAVGYSSNGQLDVTEWRLPPPNYEELLAVANQRIAELEATIDTMFTQQQLDDAVATAEAAKDDIIADMQATIDSMFTQQDIDDAVAAAEAAKDAVIAGLEGQLADFNSSLQQAFSGFEEIKSLLETPPGQRSSTSSYEGIIGDVLNEIIDMLISPPGSNISDSTPNGKKK